MDIELNQTCVIRHRKRIKARCTEFISLEIFFQMGGGGGWGGGNPYFSEGGGSTEYGWMFWQKNPVGCHITKSGPNAKPHTQCRLTSQQQIYYRSILEIFILIGTKASYDLKEIKAIVFHPTQAKSLLSYGQKYNYNCI